mmetsp:Transcript_66447/g.179650  ORF Transcript_66447/g.179650 Transcript_66447/m.179650 type:complete len:216 (+) Transcript_66447:194-841(+)
MEGVLVRGWRPSRAPSAGVISRSSERGTCWSRRGQTPPQSASSSRDNTLGCFAQLVSVPVLFLSPPAGTQLGDEPRQSLSPPLASCVVEEVYRRPCDAAVLGVRKSQRQLWLRPVLEDDLLGGQDVGAQVGQDRRLLLDKGNRHLVPHLVDGALLLGLSLLLVPLLLRVLVSPLDLRREDLHPEILLGVVLLGLGQVVRRLPRVQYEPVPVHPSF